MSFAMAIYIFIFTQKITNITATNMPHFNSEVIQLVFYGFHFTISGKTQECCLLFTLHQIIQLPPVHYIRGKLYTNLNQYNLLAQNFSTNSEKKNKLLIENRIFIVPFPCIFD